MTQISNQFTGKIVNVAERDRLVTRLEEIFKTANVPNDFRSNSLARDHPVAWAQACKDALVPINKRATCAELRTQLHQSDTIPHLVIWKHVYGIFAPYILFHCGKEDHCHLGSAVSAHHLWMKWYAALKEQYDKNYP
jgi:hypothetical protein